MIPLEHGSTVKMVMSDMADVNYYNNEQNIIRIRIGEENPKYYDFPLASNNMFPNPEDHKVLIVTTENALNNGNAILEDDELFSYRPGYKNETELANTFTWGYAFLIYKKIKKDSTNYNSTTSGMFNSNAKIPTEEKNIKFSISPPINKDYTTTIEEHNGDLKNENIGLFVTDNSVILKSGKGSIILGPEGISMLGQTYHSNSKPAKGMIQENPFSGWFPSTIMTIPLGIEYIPNLNLILSIGSACTRLSKSVSAIRKVTNITKKLVS